MNTPIRVLHVLGKLNMGGAESRIMDLYRELDRSQVQFDFLVHVRLPEGDHDTSPDHLLDIRPKEYFDDEVQRLGGHIYALPRFTGTNLAQYKRACRNFFSSHHDFAVVEGHMTSMAAVYLPIAKENGVPVTIAHARSAGVDPGIRGVATRFMRRKLARRCDLCWSCSDAASLAVFGRGAVHAGRVEIIPNAVDVKSFRYDPEKRRQIRQEFGVSDSTIVLGHVGRFDEMKNQKFLAGVVRDLEDKCPGTEFVCLLVGGGRLETEVQEEFDQKEIGEKVIFAGQCGRERTMAMYQAFDLFCFPSIYEGLPGTVIEAQAAGLPCLISDTITKEVCITREVKQLPITSAGVWAAETARLVEDGREFSEERRSMRSETAAQALGEAGYDVTIQARRMQERYLSLAEKNSAGNAG